MQLSGRSLGSRLGGSHQAEGTRTAARPGRCRCLASPCRARVDPPLGGAGPGGGARPRPGSTPWQPGCRVRFCCQTWSAPARLGSRHPSDSTLRPGLPAALACTSWAAASVAGTQAGPGTAAGRDGRTQAGSIAWATPCPRACRALVHKRRHPVRPGQPAGHSVDDIKPTHNPSSRLVTSHYIFV